MIIYNVTTQADKAIAEEWLQDGEGSATAAKPGRCRSQQQPERMMNIEILIRAPNK